MKTKKIPLASILPNNGQVPGLPRNPRLWSVKELSKLKTSIESTPELLEMRPPIVYQYGDTYIAIGGNMRLSALREMGKTDADCIVFPPYTPLTKLKEIVIKDNSKFGSWDYDALANEWNDYDLADYGLPVYVDSHENGKDGNASPLDDRVVIEIELTPDEFAFVTSKLRTLAGNMEDAVKIALGL